MAVAVKRPAQRVIDRGDQCVDIGLISRAVLHDREFVAAKPRDEILGSDANLQPRRHRAQELVADQMAE
jgi:hypothetical protein